MSAPASIRDRASAACAEPAAVPSAQSKRDDLAETLRELVDHSNQGVLVLDADGRVTFASRSLRALLPGTRLRTSDRLGDHQALAGLTGLLSKVWKSGNVHRDELHIGGESVRGNPERILQVTSGLANNGRSAWMLFHDVTDNIVTERIRRDFIRNASHELRTPLSLILGYIETLKSGIVRGAQALDRSLDVMDKHGRRMARLIEDMLTLSRFESDDPQFVRERFLVHSCVADVLEHLSPLIASRKALVSSHLPPHDGFIVGDRHYWDQIFTNLIENAVKGNSAPGLRVSISGKWADGQCVLEVRDNGVGISAEDVPFVFKRFYRCARAPARDSRGTGLGLSIVKRAVEAHGGAISLTSTPGRCTSFVITVPVDRGSA